MPAAATPIYPLPLRDGDRLTRDEFLRRWEAMPELKHAELIDGVVYMPSPVSKPHSRHHGPLAGWLFYYVIRTPGCWVDVEGTLLIEKDAPQPDVTLTVLPEYGGRTTEQDGLSAGAPELIVEVSLSSAPLDLGPKARLYERAGVTEYITALVGQERIVWRELVRGRYRDIALDADGLLRSRMFPGLWLDADALWKRDAPRLADAVDRGVATPEHAEFVRLLESRRRQ
jgi:Uma2 family endonuclease